MSDDFTEVPYPQIHHALGPRTAYLIGTKNADGGAHLCAASNVTNVGISPQIVSVGLWPTWQSTANIRRSGSFTINLMDVMHIDDIWIVGSKYSKVKLQEDDDKFVVGGFSQVAATCVDAPGVGEAIAVLECEVRRVVDDISDHVVFLAEAVAARCRRHLFDSDFIIDTHRAHPVMQISGRYFAQCESAPVPDTDWCSMLAEKRRRALTR